MSKPLPALLLLVSACGGAAAPVAEAPVDIAIPPAARPAPSPVRPSAGGAAVSVKLPAVTPAMSLSARAACEKACAFPANLPKGVAPARGDKAPLVVWEQDLAAGSAYTFPRDASLDVLTLALAGGVTLSSDARDAGQKLAPWQAARVPGAGVTVHAPDAPARVIFVVATSGEPVAPALSAAKGARPAWKTRAAAISTVDLGASEDLSWGGGAYHARLGFGDGGRASLSVLVFAKDASVAEHVHEREWEATAFLGGAGTLTRKVGGADVPAAIAPGVVTTTTAGVAHRFAAAGTEPALVIQSYAPPGPEQRFRKLAGK